MADQSSLKNGQFDDLDGAAWRAIGDDDLGRAVRVGASAARKSSAEGRAVSHRRFLKQIPAGDRPCLFRFSSP
jgi:nitrogen fixation-related uncharacterized protein